MKKILLITIYLISFCSLSLAAEINVTGSSGSLASPATFPSGENITNPANGDMCFNGGGGTFDENLCFDFESGFANILDVKSNTGVTTLRFLSMSPAITADYAVNFGSGGNTSMGEVTSGNDSFQIGMILNSASSSGYISIVEAAYKGNANRSPLALAVDPTLRLYANGADPASYGDIYHNNTDFTISTGKGALVLSPAGTQTRVTGSLTFSTTLQGTSTGSLSWNKVTTANQACNTTCTSAAVFGFDSGTTSIVSATDATADMCICAGTT